MEYLQSDSILLRIDGNYTPRSAEYSFVKFIKVIEVSRGLSRINW